MSLQHVPYDSIIRLNVKTYFHSSFLKHRLRIKGSRFTIGTFICQIHFNFRMLSALLMILRFKRGYPFYVYTNKDRKRIRQNKENFVAPKMNTYTLGMFYFYEIFTRIFFTLKVKIGKGRTL